MIKSNIKTAARALLGKARIQPIASRDELNKVSSEAARLELMIDSIKVARDEKIAALREQFDLQIEALVGEYTHLVKRLKAWAISHREEEFGNAKTITVAGNGLEFRTSPGKIEFLPGHKVGDVLDAILALPEEHEGIVELLVDIKPSLSKSNAGKLWNRDDATRDLLQSLGLVFLKEEDFTFRANREDLTAGKEGV